jgi:hypothetical protein
MALEYWKMARDPGARWMRCGAAIAVATWVVAASVAQGLLGADIARAARRVEQRIQERIERRVPPPSDPQPQRTHELEAIEPWELVSV